MLENPGARGKQGAGQARTSITVGPRTGLTLAREAGGHERQQLLSAWNVRLGEETPANEIQQRNRATKLRGSNQNGLSLGSFQPAAQAASELGHQFQFAG
jgi:hypothetical protein